MTPDQERSTAENGSGWPLSETSLKVSILLVLAAVVTLFIQIEPSRGLAISFLGVAYLLAYASARMGGWSP